MQMFFSLILIYLEQLQLMHGKLAMLKHENNKLRRANDKLRSEKDNG